MRSQVNRSCSVSPNLCFVLLGLADMWYIPACTSGIPLACLLLGCYQNDGWLTQCESDSSCGDSHQHYQQAFLFGVTRWFIVATD